MALSICYKSFTMLLEVQKNSNLYLNYDMGVCNNIFKLIRMIHTCNM